MALLLVLLAGRANAEKLNLMWDDFIAGGFSHFRCQTLKLSHFGIDDAFAVRAYQVRVRVGFVAIVAVATVSKADLENFTDLFQQVYGLVNRSQTGGRKVDPDLLINSFDTRMLSTEKKHFEDRDPLRRDTKLTLTELVEDFIQSVLWFLHVVTIRNLSINGESFSINNHK